MNAVVESTAIAVLTNNKAIGKTINRPILVFNIDAPKNYGDIMTKTI
jgi:hypothetical protein